MADNNNKKVTSANNLFNKAYNFANKLDIDITKPVVPQVTQKVNKELEKRKEKFDKSQGVVKNVTNLGKNVLLDLGQQVNSAFGTVLDPTGTAAYSIITTPQRLQEAKEGYNYYKNNPDRIVPDLGQAAYQYPATTAMLVTGAVGGAKNVTKMKPVSQAQIAEQIKPKTEVNIPSIPKGKTTSEIINSGTKKQVPESYGKSIDDTISNATRVEEPVTIDDFYNTKSVTPENDYQINTSIPRSTGELLPEYSQRGLTIKAQQAKGNEYSRYIDNFIKQGEKKFGKERFQEILNNDWLFKSEPELYQRFSEPTLLNLGALQKQMSPLRYNQLRNDRLVLQPELKVTEGYEGYTGHTAPDRSDYLKAYKPKLDVADPDNEIIVVNKSVTPSERIATNRHELGHMAAGTNPKSKYYTTFSKSHDYPDRYNESFAYSVGDVNTNKVPSQKIINEYYRDSNYDPQLSQSEVLNQRKLFEDDIRKYVNMNKLGLRPDPAAVAQYESMMKQLDPAFTSAFKPREYYTPFSFDQIRTGEHLFPQQLNVDPRFLYYDK